MSLRLSPNKLLAQPGPSGPDQPDPPGPLAAVVPPRQSEAPAVLHTAVREADPILVIPRPESGHLETPIKRMLSKSHRRFFSRVILGLLLPGRYYFITWTSSYQSPPVEKSWGALKKWLRRERPGITFVYCFTSEGKPAADNKSGGVIHLIARLPKNAKRLDARRLHAHWLRLHKAHGVTIRYVSLKDRVHLASYISDQRNMKTMGGEMVWQDGIRHWRWAKGWIPTGFTAAFGRFWAHWFNAPSEVREMALRDWIRACNVRPDEIKKMPRIQQSKKDGSELLTSNINCQAIENAM